MEPDNQVIPDCKVSCDTGWFEGFRDGSVDLSLINVTDHLSWDLELESERAA